MHEAANQRLFLLGHEAHQAAERRVARAIQQPAERHLRAAVGGGGLVQHHALLVARHGLEAHLGKVLFDGRQHIEREHRRVAHLGDGMALGREDVAGHFGEVNHAARMGAAFLLVAVEQPGAGLALDHHRQLPRQIARVAHAAVVALTLPHRHDVRRVTGQQNAAHAKACGQTGVVGVDALADVVDLVGIGHHLAHELGQVLGLRQFFLGLAGHHHELETANAVGQGGRDIRALGVAMHVDVRRAERVVAHVHHNPLIGFGATFEGHIEHAAHVAVAAITGHEKFCGDGAFAATTRVTALDRGAHARIVL